MTQRNYAHEVVTDVMHNAVPNLSVAQRARDQVEHLQEINAELLAALQAIIASLEWEERRSGLTYNGYETAKAAIARATGKEIA